MGDSQIFTAYESAKICKRKEFEFQICIRIN